MGLPARGRFEVLFPDGAWRRLGFDAHQSAYLAFAAREMHGGYEPVETRFLDAVLPKCRVFYDIGANWGYYTLLAATHPAFDGEIAAFEISAQMNAALTGMSDALGLDGLSIAGHGLSDRSGTVAATDWRAAHLTRVLPDGAGRPGSRRAEVRRMDDLTLPPPDLIKMDVEDHEANVLRGGLGVLEANRPLILFESRLGDAGGEAGELLRAKGYGIYALTLDGDGTLLRARPVSPPVSPPDSGPGGAGLLAVPEGRERRWFP